MIIDQSLLYLVFPKYLRKSCIKNFPIIYQSKIYFYQKQFGFQQSHSTEHAIIQLTDQINDKFEINCFTLGICIDLSKAFDTVNPQIQISKLKNYGVKGKKLSRCKSYLKNRKQYLNYNNDVTNLAQIKCGIPQGSILGPLLFLIYVMACVIYQTYWSL